MVVILEPYHQGCGFQLSTARRKSSQDPRCSPRGQRHADFSGRGSCSWNSSRARKAVRRIVKTSPTARSCLSLKTGPLDTRAREGGSHQPQASVSSGPRMPQQSLRRACCMQLWWCVVCCGVHVAAAHLASNEVFGQFNSQSSVADDSSACTTHADCFVVGATCRSDAAARSVDDAARTPCIACDRCSASYNLGTAPRLCVSGACSCSGDSVVFGVVPRVHLAHYESGVCDHDGSKCETELTL